MQVPFGRWLRLILVRTRPASGAALTRPSGPQTGGRAVPQPASFFWTTRKCALREPASPLPQRQHFHGSL